MYQRIAQGKERRKAALDVARGTYPRIARTTAITVEFTEKHDTLESATIAASLTTDLSKLGEEITTRIELEDQLILTMLDEKYRIPERGASA